MAPYNLQILRIKGRAWNTLKYNITLRGAFVKYLAIILEGKDTRCSKRNVSSQCQTIWVWEIWTPNLPENNVVICNIKFILVLVFVIYELLILLRTGQLAFWIIDLQVHLISNCIPGIQNHINILGIKIQVLACCGATNRIVIINSHCLDSIWWNQDSIQIRTDTGRRYLLHHSSNDWSRICSSYHAMYLGRYVRKLLRKKIQLHAIYLPKRYITSIYQKKFNYFCPNKTQLYTLYLSPRCAPGFLSAKRMKPVATYIHVFSQHSSFKLHSYSRHEPDFYGNCLSAKGVNIKCSSPRIM